MKSLCYVLAINVVLSAADNLDSQNGSNEAKVESRKVKHTISRIYNLPHNVPRMGRNNGNYNQFLKILKDPLLEQQQISTSETYTELSNIVTEAPKIKIQDESIINNLKENASKFLLLSNKNAKRERDVDNTVSKKETELNAETLNEIIQNLMASNVSDLDRKQISKGKLVIYYDGNEDYSEVPIEINNNSENKQLDVDKFMQIDDELHKLFTQYKVPENIFHTIQSRVHIEPTDRTKNLITALVKYINFNGQLNDEIINQLKNLISRNNIEMDLAKLLMLLKDSKDDETESQIDVIKSMFDDAELEIQRSNKGTPIDLPIINEKNDKSKEIADVLIPNSNLLLHPTNEVIATKDKIIKINKEQNKGGYTKNHLKLDEDILQTPITMNPNDVMKSGIQNIQIPDLINYYKNKNSKKKLSEDTLNEIISPLIQNSMRNCDLNDCGPEKKLYSYDLDGLKGFISDVIPNLQQLDSKVPVLSNIPIEEYLDNNRKPFFIYVMFSDSEKNSELSDYLTKIDPHFTLPNIETVIKNIEKNKFNEENMSILHVIKEVIKNIPHHEEIQSGIDHSSKTYSPEDIMDIISNPKKSINSDTSFGHSTQNPESNSKNELIDEIFGNLLNNTENPTKLNPADQILYILNNLTDHNEVKNNIRFEEILNLLPNINKKPEYNLVREGSEKNVIERIKELFLNPENYSPEQIPGVEELKTITYDPYSLKIIMQVILQDISSRKKNQVKIENKNMDHQTEALIEQVRYIQKVLEKLNMSQHVRKEIIKKEIENGVSKIITESVEYCTKNVKREVELRIQKALKNN